MIDSKHTKEDLKEMQSLPLERKIKITQTRIMEWYLRHEGKVYISFSGGKDSTVLIDITRRMYPDIEAVFADTGLEYPEIRDFVKTFDNVTWLHPVKYDREKREWVRTNFREVINTHGYPIISKEIADKIEKNRRNPNGHTKDMFEGVVKFGGSSPFNHSKYRYLLKAPFAISGKCCDAMKKNPFMLFNRQSKKYPIIGTMASESAVRRRVWLKYGCNAFDKKHRSSQPMSFWTEQDVLKYLKEYNIPYASIYGSIVEEMTAYKKKENHPTGKLLLTGIDRTGCMFCGFGCHLEKEPNRYKRMKETHPKQYDYCIRPTEEGGLGMGRVLDFIGVEY